MKSDDGCAKMEGCGGVVGGCLFGVVMPLFVCKYEKIGDCVGGGGGGGGFDCVGGCEMRLNLSRREELGADDGIGLDTYGGWGGCGGCCGWAFCGWAYCCWYCFGS